MPAVPAAVRRSRRRRRPAPCSARARRIAIAERAAEVPRVHAFEDARQLPVREGDIEVEVRDVAAGHLRVPLGDASPRPEPGFGGRAGAPGTGRIVGARPVDGQQPDVGERVAERADLPVEHGDQLAVVADHAVVEAVVAVHQRGARLVGDACREGVVNAVDRRQVARALLADLCRTSDATAGRCSPRGGRGRRARRRRGRQHGSSPSCRRATRLALVRASGVSTARAVSASRTT